MTEIRQIISIAKNINKEGREGETERKRERLREGSEVENKGHSCLHTIYNPVEESNQERTKVDKIIKIINCIKGL